MVRFLWYLSAPFLFKDYSGNNMCNTACICLWIGISIDIWVTNNFTNSVWPYVMQFKWYLNAHFVKLPNKAKKCNMNEFYTEYMDFNHIRLFCHIHLTYLLTKVCQKHVYLVKRMWFDGYFLIWKAHQKRIKQLILSIPLQDLDEIFWYLAGGYLEYSQTKLFNQLYQTSHPWSAIWVCFFWIENNIIKSDGPCPQIGREIVIVIIHISKHFFEL